MFTSETSSHCANDDTSADTAGDDLSLNTSFKQVNKVCGFRYVTSQNWDWKTSIFNNNAYLNNQSNYHTLDIKFNFVKSLKNLISPLTTIYISRLISTF